MVTGDPFQAVAIGHEALELTGAIPHYALDRNVITCFSGVSEAG